MLNSPRVMFLLTTRTTDFYNRFIELIFYNIGQSQRQVVLTRL